MFTHVVKRLVENGTSITSLNDNLNYKKGAKVTNEIVGSGLYSGPPQIHYQGLDCMESQCHEPTRFQAL
jgi:hypothetical protein